ncbi:MAG: methyltransferase domain-containing protein [Cyanobacteria bacterium REEB65]|nr:methyltransferase domain-containing protein [Cyanobacteria bacterium REEB65]
MPSDETRSLQRFEASYRQGSPPWDIGKPQEAIVALAAAGKIRGRVLDSGCGTGENALFLAERGFEVTGIDLSVTAIERAKKKASDRGVAVVFAVGDALELAERGEQFDTIVDSGVFHVFDDADRQRYVASLAAALAPGGKYYAIVFSDEQPGTWGPRRIRREEVHVSFADGWHVDEIVPVPFHINPDAVGSDAEGRPTVKAWLASLTRR